MIFIKKKNEPQEYTDWKNFENENWIPTFDKLSGSVKKSVYDALLVEQGNICCYCERELHDNDYHIEHLNPQFKHEGDDLDYSNLLCSCLNKTDLRSFVQGYLRGRQDEKINEFQSLIIFLFRQYTS